MNVLHSTISTLIPVQRFKLTWLRKESTEMAEEIRSHFPVDSDYTRQPQSPLDCVRATHPHFYPGTVHESSS